MKISFKILPEGSDIIMEYGAFGFEVMVLRQNHLFLGVGAAHAGTIAVVTRGDPSGTDTLNPGDFLGMFLVGGTKHFSFVRSGGRQQAFIVHAGDDVFKLSVAIFLLHFRVVRFDPGRKNDGPHIDVHLFRRLIQIDGVVLTHPFADAAFFLFEVNAAFIDIGDQGNGLGEINMGGFILANALIERVRVFDRTVFDTGGATRTLFLYDVTGFLDKGDLKVSSAAFDTVNFSICQDLYVWMPADLDQFR